jgi:hypothetical protein
MAEISPRIIHPIIDIAHLLTRIALPMFNNNDRYWFISGGQRSAGAALGDRRSGPKLAGPLRPA